MNFRQSTLSSFFGSNTTGQSQQNSSNSIIQNLLSPSSISSLFHPQSTPPVAAPTTPKYPNPTKSSTTLPIHQQQQKQQQQNQQQEQQQPQHPPRQQSHLLQLLSQHAPSKQSQPPYQANTESTMSRISRNFMPFIEPNSTEKKPISYLERMALQNRPSPYQEVDDPVRGKNASTSQFQYDDDDNEDEDDDIVEITAPTTAQQKKSTTSTTSTTTTNNKRKLYDDDEDEEDIDVESEEEFVKKISSTLNQTKSNQQTQQSNEWTSKQQQYSTQGHPNSLKGAPPPLKPGFDLSQFRYQLDPASLKAERQKRSETLKPANLIPPHPLFGGMNATQPQNTQPVILPTSLKSIVSTESPATPILQSNSEHSDNDDDDSEEMSGDETTKKQRLTNSSEKRNQPKKHQFQCIKNYYDGLHEKTLRREKHRLKEEEKIQRARQQLIEAAQQKEKDRIDSERRAQREKLVQIKRADELRKRKKKEAITQNLQMRTTLEYRNRMKEQLRNMNVEEQLKENRMTAATSTDINDTTGVHSIAGNMKRNLMDFDFLTEGTDEAVDTNNYYALLRFVFSQDFNRTDILRIENKRIPNKFSNWKEYFSIFEYLFLMECVASIQSAFVSYRSHENYRSPLGCYVRPVSMKENSHGFLELQVCRRGSDLDEGEIRSSIEDDYYTLMSMRNHAVLLSSTSDMDLSTLSTKPTRLGQPFLFFGWVVPPDKADPKSLLKVYVDLESSTFSAAFEESMVYISIFNFTKMTTFIREYLAIKNMQILFPLLDELRLKYNHSQFQSIKEISLTSEGICMLQGPPGTGKTHTLLGLLSGFYYYIKKNPKSTKPKIMICAPSNTAVDEIVSRIVESGLHQPGGVTVRINVVRIGAIDYVPKDNVKRASLEYQIEKKLREMGLQQQQQSFSSQNNAKNQLEQETLIDMRINVARVNQDIEKAKKELVGSELKDQLNHLFSKKRELKAKIAVQKLDKVARRDQIKQVSDQILGLADVVCCTLTSSLSEKLERFKDQIEVLIVDEAAQCSEPNNIIPLFYQPNKMVLIGDPKQLPATTFQPESNITKYNRSLFERIIDNQIQPYFLDEQYRMHPDIREFPSSAFYDNKLRDGQYVLTREFPRYVQRMERHNVQFIDITFSRERFSNKSYENDAEAEGALSICSAVFATLRENESPSIGIITPYKQQTKLINDMIRRTIEKQFWKFIQVNTVDSFQGQEKDIIIFTTVRASHPNDKYRERMIGFLQDERRMNVALTRARFCLFVLGHADTLNSNLIWGNYVDSMAAKKRYGKLTRREELRGIGQYIMTGALISPESLSSAYVKKDWGEEFRLAQQVKEQVKELKLTDFEEEPAPQSMEIEDAAAENDENGSTTAAAAAQENGGNIEDAENTYNEVYYDSIQKRSGVSIQDAIDQANEQKYMRQYGSGIKGLSSLVGLSGTTKTQPKPPQQVVIDPSENQIIVIPSSNASESNAIAAAAAADAAGQASVCDLFDENSMIDIEIDQPAIKSDKDTNVLDIYDQMQLQKKQRLAAAAKKDRHQEKRSKDGSVSSNSSSSNPNTLYVNLSPKRSGGSGSGSGSSSNSMKTSSATSPTTHFSISSSNQSSSLQSSDKEREKQRQREKEQQKQQLIDKDLQQKVKIMSQQQQKEKEQQKQKEQITQQLQQVQQLQQQQKIQKEKEMQIAKEKEIERARQKANNVLYCPVLPDFPSPTKQPPSSATSQSNSSSKQQQANSTSPSFASPHSVSNKYSSNPISKPETKPFLHSSSSYEHNNNLNNKHQSLSSLHQQKPQQLNVQSRTNPPNNDSDHISLPSSLSSLFHASSASTTTVATKSTGSSSNQIKNPNTNNNSSTNNASSNNNSSSNGNNHNKSKDEDEPKSMFAQLSGLVSQKTSEKDKSPVAKAQQQQKQASVYESITQQRSTSGPSVKSNSNSHSHSTGHSSGQQQSKHQPYTPQSNNFQQKSPQQQSSSQSQQLHNNNNHYSSSSSSNNNSSTSLRQLIVTKQNIIEKQKHTQQSPSSSNPAHSLSPADSRYNKPHLQLNTNNHTTGSPLSSLIKPQQQTMKQQSNGQTSQHSDNITRMKSSDNISDILNNIYIRKQ